MFSRLVRKQHYVGSFWGAAKITYTHTAVYFNLGTFLMMTATFWYTTGWKWGLRYLGFNLTYPGFMLCLGLGAILAMWVIYKFEMPSSFRFWFDQGYRHSTLLPSDLARIESKIDKLLGRGVCNRETRIKKRRMRYEKYTA